MSNEGRKTPSNNNQDQRKAPDKPFNKHHPIKPAPPRPSRTPVPGEKNNKK